MPEPSPRPVTAARRGRRGLVVFFVVLTLLVTGIDQYTKVLAVQRLEPYVVQPLLGDVLSLQLIFNPGAAFSLATGLTWVLTIVAAVVVVVVLRAARRMGSAMWATALALLLGGALGNLIDRLFREPGFARGEVVDFISYNGWFVGNVADIAIVVAAALVAILALRGVEIDGSRAGKPDDEAGEHSAGDVGDVDDAAGPADLAGGSSPHRDYEPTIASPESAAGHPDVATWAQRAEED